MIWFFVCFFGGEEVVILSVNLSPICFIDFGVISYANINY